MNILYIIRGLPGSGKSTLAKELAPGAHYEADQYFTHPETGEYRFDASQLSIAHAKCHQHVICAMQDGISTIAVANTFSRKWEFQNYIDSAIRSNYKVIEVTLRSDFTSIHAVPQESIDAMRARWEY